MTGASLLSPELAGIINREFDQRQQEELASDFQWILTAGFGDLIFEVKNGHIRFVRVKSSRDYDELTGEAKKSSMREVK